MAHVGLLVAIGPPVANLIYGTWAIEGQLRPSTAAIGLATFLGAGIYVSRRVRRQWKELLKLRLGLDAEEAIGQELNYLMPLGFRVFHDIPCKDFNIDHVVVGVSGLFVVETKGRSKPLEENEVTFDGERLQFPGWREVTPVRQVRAALPDCRRSKRSFRPQAAAATTGHSPQRLTWPQSGRCAGCALR
jgi:hypothetical protein